MAWGYEKAEAVKGMIEGEVTESLPASVLQQHDIFLRLARSLISLKNVL